MIPQADVLHMTDADLSTYREVVREEAIETNDPGGNLSARQNLIDAILYDRKLNR